MPRKKLACEGPSPCEFFSPGEIVFDQNAKGKLSPEDVLPALGRHIFGDWGAVSGRRQRANQQALLTRKPLQSVYFSSDGVKFSIVTNEDRSVTTVRII